MKALGVVAVLAAMGIAGCQEAPAVAAPEPSPAAPAGLQIRPGQNYNPYMAGDLTPFMPEGSHVPPGGFIAMPNPLTDGQVTYDDDTVASVDQMAKDVAAYIAWASDPRQVQRKQSGLGVLIFLFIFAGITYLSYRRIWKGVAH